MFKHAALILGDDYSDDESEGNYYGHRGSGREQRFPRQVSRSSNILSGNQNNDSAGLNQDKITNPTIQGVKIGLDATNVLTTTVATVAAQCYGISKTTSASVKVAKEQTTQKQLEKDTEQIRLEIARLESGVRVAAFSETREQRLIGQSQPAENTNRLTNRVIDVVTDTIIVHMKDKYKNKDILSVNDKLKEEISNALKELPSDKLERLRNKEARDSLSNYVNEEIDIDVLLPEPGVLKPNSIYVAIENWLLETNTFTP